MADERFREAIELLTVAGFSSAARLLLHAQTQGAGGSAAPPTIAAQPPALRDKPLADDRQYPDVDPRELEPEFSIHMLAMTAEGLHGKSEIAAQLALRDKRFLKLQSDMLENEAEERQAVVPSPLHLAAVKVAEALLLVKYRDVSCPLCNHPMAAQGPRCPVVAYENAKRNSAAKCCI